MRLPDSGVGTRECQLGSDIRSGPPSLIGPGDATLGHMPTLRRRLLEPAWTGSRRATGLIALAVPFALASLVVLAVVSLAVAPSALAENASASASAPASEAPASAAPASASPSTGPASGGAGDDGLAGFLGTGLVVIVLGGSSLFLIRTLSARQQTPPPKGRNRRR